MQRSIVLGGGCFWCLEAVFLRLKGVVEVDPGYAGGTVADPSYEEVCSGTTGHAEVVRVEYDPAVITLKDILHVFFTLHDPTTLNRQGADVGTQYRSAVLYSEPSEREEVQAVIEEFAGNGIWEDPIVTEVAQLEAFYPAEGYHRRYFDKHPEQGYCQVVIAPKVAKLRKEFQEKLAA